MDMSICKLNVQSIWSGYKIYEVLFLLVTSNFFCPSRSLCSFLFNSDHRFILGFFFHYTIENVVIKIYLITKWIMYAYIVISMANISKYHFDNKEVNVGCHAFNDFELHLALTSWGYLKICILCAFEVC